MQSDRLMAKNVIASLDTSGYLDTPSAVCSDHSVISVHSGRTGSASHTDSVNLEKFKCGLVHGRAIPSTIRKVIQHRPFVRLGPVSPLQ